MSLIPKRRSHRRANIAGPLGALPKSPTASPTSFYSPTISYLNQLELRMTARKIKLGGKDVSYDLVVTPTSDRSQQWTVSHSFKELQKFQLKLLDVMQLGHICHANCPYLYSSIKGRFPKECYLCSTSSYVMRKRSHAIEECFTTLLEALCDRKNHSSCSILPDLVAKELILFLNQDLPIEHPFRWENFATCSKRLSTSSTLLSTDDSSRGLSPSRLSKCWLSSSDDSLDSFYSVGSNNSILDTCGLCTKESKEPLTNLSCGHRFHDECIILKLNETLACPTCNQKL